MLLELIGGDGASDWPGASSLSFATPVPGTFTTGPVTGLVTSGWIPCGLYGAAGFAAPAGTRSAFSSAPGLPSGTDRLSTRIASWPSAFLAASSARRLASALRAATAASTADTRSAVASVTGWDPVVSSCAMPAAALWVSSEWSANVWPSSCTFASSAGVRASVVGAGALRACGKLGSAPSCLATAFVVVFAGAFFAAAFLAGVERTADFVVFFVAMIVSEGGMPGGLVSRPCGG